MPDRSRPPYRADHIGSLKRPDGLVPARQDFLAGKMAQEQLVRLEDEAIKSAIALQKKVGIKSFTDGEYRRALFFDGFFDKLEGIEVQHGVRLNTVKPLDPAHIVAGQRLPPVAPVPFVVGKLKHKKPIYLDEFEYVKSLVDESEIPNIKITMCSPLWWDYRFGKDWIRTESGLYESRAELIADLAAVYQAEIAALYAAGCRNIQIDEPSLTFICYPPISEAFKAEGADPDSILEDQINCLNACLKDVPADMVVGIHLCRGNFRGHHMTEGSYNPIAEKLFTKLNVNCFYLEYDTDRAGGFEPLIYLPKGKIAVLGLVSTKNAQLESPEVLESRIAEAVAVIQNAHPERTREEILDQLCLSPQCGFASDMVGNPVTLKDMENKLKLVVDTSRRIWNY